MVFWRVLTRMGLFAEPGYREKTGALALPFLRAPAGVTPGDLRISRTNVSAPVTAFSQRQAPKSGPLSLMAVPQTPGAPVLTLIEENPSLHRENTRWRDIIQPVTLKA